MLHILSVLQYSFFFSLPCLLFFFSILTSQWGGVMVVILISFSLMPMVSSIFFPGVYWPFGYPFCNVTFQVSDHFFFYWVFFLLQVLDTVSLSYKCISNTFPHCVACLFIKLQLVSFDKKKFLILMRSNLLIFFFMLSTI